MRRAGRLAAAVLVTAACRFAAVAQISGAERDSSTRPTAESRQTGDPSQVSAIAPAQKTSTQPVSAGESAKAERFYLEGAKLLQAQDYTHAEERFALAVRLDPRRPEYVQALALAQEHRVTKLIQQAAATRAKDPGQADALLAQARAVDAANPRLTQRGGPEAAAPVVVPGALRTELASTIALRPSAGRQSMHQRGDTRSVATALGQIYGIRIVADNELTAKQLRLDLDDVDFAQASHVLQMSSGTLIVPLDAQTALIADDTATNRTRLERIAEEAFDLPGYSTEQINDVANVAKTVFEIKQVSVQPLGKTIVLRAPEDTLAAADAIFRDLVDTGPEVLLELKLYAVDRSNTRNLGVILPQSINSYSVAAETQNVLSQNASLVQQLIASGVLPATATPQQIALYLLFVAGLGNNSLIQNSFLIFGGGLSLGAVSAGNNPILNLALTQSDARTLDDLQLRVGDRQTATFRSGIRYPIQTSLFTDVASPTGAGALGNIQVNGVPLSSLLSQFLGSSSGISSGAVLPQIQYQDLGLTVKASPHVQRSGDMAMHLELTVDALAGSSLNGIPVLASRNTSSDLTLRDGETTMMVSYLSRAESAAVSGLPGLSEIPGFQSTTNQNKNVATSELVVLLTPHIVRRGHLHATGPYIPLQNRPSSE